MMFGYVAFDWNEVYFDQIQQMDVLHCYVTRLILQTVLLAISSHDD